MKILSPLFVHLVAVLNEHYQRQETLDISQLSTLLGTTSHEVHGLLDTLNHYGVMRPWDSKHNTIRLQEPLALLDPAVLQKHLTPLAATVEVFETLHSTNGYLKEMLLTPSPATSIKNALMRWCFAEHQTQGRGRLGRLWHSPFAQNIYGSCHYRFQKKMRALSGLSLVVGLALVKALSLYDLPESPQVKWPNDILYQHKKLAGILIELQTAGPNGCDAIIGVGININMLKGSEEALTQPWCSLREILGGPVDRQRFIIQWVSILGDALKKFEALGLGPFVAAWNAVDALFNQPITLEHEGNLWHGTAQGINAEGHLRVTLESGETKAYAFGEASLVRRRGG